MKTRSKGLFLAGTVSAVAFVSVWSLAETSPTPLPSASPSSSPSSSPSASPSTSASPSAVQQTVYTFALNALNASESGGGAGGSGTVVVDQDHFGVSLAATGLSPGEHLARIHKGSVCPTDNADDGNRDGVVDVIEGLPRYGGILIGLDGDLSSYAAGASFAPSANPDGTLFYNGSGTFSSLLTDLHRTPAPPAGTGVVTLAPEELLDLDDAVVVVQGIDPSVSLPRTVQTVTGSTPNQSLPVACGKLVRTEGPQVQVGASPAPTESPSSSPSASPSTSASPSPSPSPSPSGSPSPSQ